MAGPCPPCGPFIIGRILAAETSALKIATSTLGLPSFCSSRGNQKDYRQLCLLCPWQKEIPAVEKKTDHSLLGETPDVSSTRTLELQRTTERQRREAEAPAGSTRARGVRHRRCRRSRPLRRAVELRCARRVEKPSLAVEVA